MNMDLWDTLYVAVISTNDIPHDSNILDPSITIYRKNGLSLHGKSKH